MLDVEREEFLSALESLLSITEGCTVWLIDADLREWKRISAWTADMRDREFDKGEGVG